MPGPAHEHHEAAATDHRSVDSRPSSRSPGADPAGRRGLRTPAQLIALQRRAGNAAVSRALGGNATPDSPTVQRDDPEPVEHISKGMFTVTSGGMTHPGTVSARRVDGRGIVVSSPDVRLNATVEKHADSPLGAGNLMQVGPVQTINGSRRVGVYRTGGDPTMPIVTRHTSTVEQSRDAQFQENRDGTLRADVPEPWYSRPAPLSDSAPRNTVNFHDKPGFDLPSSIGQGILTEIEGAESFTTSVAAKYRSDVVHLENQSWSIDWGMNIGALGRGAGAVVTSEASSEAPQVTTGEIAVNRVNSWLGFPTVDAAMGVPAQVLLANLLPARQNDRSSYNNIVAALRRKRIRMMITITVDETAEAFGADEIMVTVNGHQSSSDGPITLNDGQWDVFNLDFHEVVDVERITESGYGVEVVAQDVGTISNDPARKRWNFPFTSSRRNYRMSGGGGGKYKVMADISG